SHHYQAKPKHNERNARDENEDNAFPDSPRPGKLTATLIHFPYQLRKPPPAYLVILVHRRLPLLPPDPADNTRAAVGKAWDARPARDPGCRKRIPWRPRRIRPHW